MDFRIVGSGLEAGRGFPLSGLVGWPGDQAAERAPPHDLRGSWPYQRYLIGLWHVWLPPGAVGARRFGNLWQPVAPCVRLWRPVGTDWMPLYKSLEPSMPGGLRLRCPDATLAGLAGWLAWLAGLAGWLQLAGCCWLAAAG